MRLLITRPLEDAAPVAGLLQARGFETVIEPLLRIRYDSGEPLDLSGVQGVLITSANGARALSQATGARDVKLLSVGGASRRVAMDLGFVDVAAAGGDVAALVGLAAARFDPGAGPLLHVAGSVTAGDLAGQLEKVGFSVIRRVLYEAQPVGVLSAALTLEMQTGKIDGVLLYSPRTAGIFVELIVGANLAKESRGLTAFCLSQAVADALAPLQGMRVLVASRPEQESMLTLLN